ncbi:complex I intermediate-associated protein 30 [Calliopsis andreniformis]|uniref:complex I intermediate-associated protein 30 n=1 Tax=Calliopsis andreniformis TaxID=337506 RepID=UPI003FCC62A9
MFRMIHVCSRIPNKRNLHTNNCLYYNEPKRSNYPVVYDRPPKDENFSLLGRLREGWKNVKEEFSLLAHEIRDGYTLHKSVVIPNEDVVVWKFDGTEKSLDQWIVTCDSDYNEGFSTAKLDLSPRGTGIFHGTLSTRTPKDGKIDKSGFCNITTVRKIKSFQRKDYYDWSEFNTLVMKVRGDGRCYAINILQKGNVDVTWYDSYHYVLYTRGGPYWQYVKIPFSKFAFGWKGVLQDNQIPMPKELVTNLGITVSDRKNGPFKLEIDYIGVYLDLFHMESSAYEMYDQSKM